MKKLLGAPLALALLVTLSTASQEDEATRQLMEAKTGYSHRLLDAIVVGDFDTVGEQAFRLKAVAETGDWHVLKTEEYARASESFIRATERLIEVSKTKSSDGAALAYMDVTLECVNCHRYIREYRAEHPGGGSRRR